MYKTMFRVLEKNATKLAPSIVWGGITNSNWNVLFVSIMNVSKRTLKYSKNQNFSKIWLLFNTISISKSKIEWERQETPREKPTLPTGGAALNEIRKAWPHQLQGGLVPFFWKFWNLWKDCSIILLLILEKPKGTLVLEIQCLKSWVTWKR